MGAHAFAGDTQLTLDPAWRQCAAPLLRCLYSPEASAFFIEQLLVRKTFAQATLALTLTLTLILTLTLTLTHTPARRSRAAFGACCCRRCSTRRWASRP